MVPRALGQQADVPAGHFDDAVLTADTIALEPDVLEYQLYAPNVGLVLALGISGGGREELVSMPLWPGKVPFGTHRHDR